MIGFISSVATGVTQWDKCQAEKRREEEIKVNRRLAHAREPARLSHELVMRKRLDEELERFDDAARLSDHETACAVERSLDFSYGIGAIKIMPQPKEQWEPTNEQATRIEAVLRSGSCDAGFEAAVEIGDLDTACERSLGLERAMRYGKNPDREKQTDELCEEAGWVRRDKGPGRSFHGRWRRPTEPENPKPFGGSR